MILRERLAELLAKQEIGHQADFNSLTGEWKKEYRKNADEIIKLFTDSIRNLEFKVNKNKTI